MLIINYYLIRIYKVYLPHNILPFIQQWFVIDYATAAIIYITTTTVADVTAIYFGGYTAETATAAYHTDAATTFLLFVCRRFGHYIFIEPFTII